MSEQKDPREPTPCRYCQALIVWAKNERSGKPMPFDAEPDPELESGWELFMSHKEAKARYIRVRKGERLRRVHFETCENYTPKQGDMVGRDRVAEVRDALPAGYMAMFGRAARGR